MKLAQTTLLVFLISGCSSMAHYGNPYETTQALEDNKVFKDISVTTKVRPRDDIIQMVMTMTPKPHIKGMEDICNPWDEIIKKEAQEYTDDGWHVIAKLLVKNEHKSTIATCNTYVKTNRPYRKTKGDL